MALLSLVVFASFVVCSTAIRFPYNPNPRYFTEVKETVPDDIVCPSYNIYYDDDDLVVILRKDACEMIVDKYSIQNSIDVLGQQRGDDKTTYVPILRFKNLSPICPSLPYEYRGLKVMVQTSPGCQLTFGVKQFYERRPHSSQPVLVAKPVVEVI